MSFDSLGLSAELQRAVADQGYSTPTPVQRAAIPVIIQGRDILAGAQTGTGKTAGFTLPLLHKLHAGPRHVKGRRLARALILVPTRELAAQVGASVTTYGRHLPLSSTTIFGGVKISPQIKALRRGVDILVATPGRLLDHVSQQTLDLSAIEILVLDEADRMLDMGFIRDIRRIIDLLPKRRQNLMFSATYSSDIRKLADTLLVKPELIEVARRNTPTELVSQVVHPVDRERKRELLAFMIGSQNWRQVLVFTRTKHGANRLSQQLAKDGISSAAIHGNKTQGARTRALADFKRGAVRVLVATDIASRGLDIDQLPHVVNYELPNVPEDYVHRIGRTGRAGNEGQAVSLVCGDEHQLLVDIERLLKRDLPKVVIPGYEATAAARAKPALQRKPGTAAPTGKSQQPPRRKPKATAPAGRSDQPARRKPKTAAPAGKSNNPPGRKRSAAPTPAGQARKRPRNRRARAA